MRSKFNTLFPLSSGSSKWFIYSLKNCKYTRYIMYCHEYQNRNHCSLLAVRFLSLKHKPQQIPSTRSLFFFNCAFKKVFLTKLGMNFNCLGLYGQVFKLAWDSVSLVLRQVEERKVNVQGRLRAFLFLQTGQEDHLSLSPCSLIKILSLWQIRTMCI